tara:strand:+ start:1015 stop:1485 length:471 start_codon:yes stop_codon:yes gene_type:complete
MDLKIVDDILNDNIINIILVIFVVIFQCVLLPKLPSQMLSFADNIIFKVVILTLIAFMANRNLRLSILIAVLFLLILNIANNNNIETYCNLQQGAGNCTSSSHNYDSVKQKGAGNCQSDSNHNLLKKKTGGNSITMEDAEMTDLEKKVAEQMKEYF